MVNGIWVIESAKNVDDNVFAVDMRGKMNPFETPEDMEHFRSAKRLLAAEYAECCICFEPMCLEPLCVLLDGDSQRACSHVHHVRCIDGLNYNAQAGYMFNCPFCREEFMSFDTLPADFLQHPDEYWLVVAGSRERLPWREATELIPCIVPIDPLNVEKNEETLQRLYCTGEDKGVTQEAFMRLIRSFAADMEPKLEETRRARSRRTMLMDASAPLEQTSPLEQSKNGDVEPDPRNTRFTRNLGRTRTIRRRVLPLLDGEQTSDVAPDREKNWFDQWQNDGKLTCAELVRALTKTLDPECTRDAEIELAVRAMWRSLDRTGKGHITKKDFDDDGGAILRNYFRLSKVKRVDLLDDTTVEPSVDPISIMQLSDMPSTAISVPC